MCALSVGLLNRHDMGRSQWHGSVSVPVAASADRVWETARDFCGVQKWAPKLDVCRIVEGIEQKPGCVRYCAGNSLRGTDNKIAWVKEKLTSIDHANHSYTYIVTDGNMGLQGYEATFQVLPKTEGSSLIKWSFHLDPVPNCTEEQLVPRLSSGLIAMGKALEELVLSS